MNTITSHDMRHIIAHLDSIKELTDLLRRAHFEVPYNLVYGAAGGESAIRDMLLRTCVSAVEVEPAGNVS